MRCLGVFFVGLVLILLLIGGAFYLGEQSFLARADLATGTVSKMDRTPGIDSGYTYCPIFVFKTQDGSTQTQAGNVCSPPPAYKAGDRQELYYDPREPKHIQMNNFRSMYTAAFSWGVSGAPFILFVLYLFIAGIFRPKAQSSVRSGNQRTAPPGWSS